VQVSLRWLCSGEKKKIDPKKQAKLEKFAAKQAKLQAAASAANSPEASPSNSSVRPAVLHIRRDRHRRGAYAGVDVSKGQSSPLLQLKKKEKAKETVEEDLTDPTVKGERKGATAFGHSQC